MTTTNDSTTPGQASLTKRMLIGGLIGLILISLFVFPVTPAPSWGKFWMIRPLIITPLAGAMGGLCNYYIMSFHHEFGVNKTVAMIISIFVFLVGLWLGTVLGLDGTLWD